MSALDGNMDGRLQIVSVNQDAGISPQRQKGAAIHLTAMRCAFRQLGVAVKEIDQSDAGETERQLQKIHEAEPIDMIYERYALGRSCAAQFAKKRNIPFALEVNAPLADEQARWRGHTEDEKDRVEDRLTFSAADFVGAVSSQVEQYALMRGARKDAICICPNGIDTSLFKTDLGAEQDLTNRPPPGWFVLGFHGRERPWHGFDMLVDVTRTLLARKHPVHLFVIGEGDFDDLTRLPPGSYTRIGWLPHKEIPGYLSTFHALPLTYSADLPCYFSPLKLMEGMACGVVPLVPNLGDLPKLVNHGVTGLVYPADDTEVLFEQLVKLISNQKMHQKLSKNAASAAKAYDWTRIAGLVLNRLGLSAFEPRLGKAISE